MSSLKSVLSGLITAGVTAAPASADSADYLRYFNGPPGLAPGENPSIAMEAEAVTADLGPERVQVRASFTFVNRGGATEVTMFFPLASYEWLLVASEGLDTPAELNGYLSEKYGVTVDEPVRENVFPLPLEGKPSLPAYPNGESAISRNAGFHVSGDGGEIPVELVHRAEYERRSRGTNWMNTDTFARWKVSFGAGETKKITCKYDASYEIGKHGWGAQWFVYPLYTGKTWAGPIGAGTITVTYRADGPGAPVSFRSPGMPPAEVSADENETRIVWRFTAFEPGEDAEVWITVAKSLNEESRARGLTDLGLSPDKPGEPGRVLVNNLSFRTEPSAEAPRVEGRPTLAKDTPLAVLESRGEWWRVRVPGGAGEWGE